MGRCDHGTTALVGSSYRAQVAVSEDAEALLCEAHSGLDYRPNPNYRSPITALNDRLVRNAHDATACRLESAGGEDLATILGSGAAAHSATGWRRPEYQ